MSSTTTCVMVHARPCTWTHRHPVCQYLVWETIRKPTDTGQGVSGKILVHPVR
jgi:hypothetical protein